MRHKSMDGFTGSFHKQKNKFVITLLLASFLLLPLLSLQNTPSVQFEYWKTFVHGGISLRNNLEIVTASILFITFGWMLSLIFLVALERSFDKVSQERLEALDMFSLGMSGAPIFLAIVCFISVNLGIWPLFILLLVTTILLISIRAQLESVIKPVNGSSREKYLGLSFFILLLVNLLLIRLGYIFELEFPLNIDSVNHTFFAIQSLDTTSFLNLPYYHYAIHYVFAAISLITQETIPKIILVFGQILQAILPITIFFPVHKITRSTKIALFATLMVGVGFSMPAEATSWGKYPALMAMSCLVYIFYIANRLTRQKRVHLVQVFLLACLAILVAFIHSRVVVLYLVALLFYGLEKLVIIGNSGRRLMVVTCLLTAAIVLALVDNRLIAGEWALAWIPYTENNLLLGIFLFSLAFSSAYYPKYTYYIFLSVITVMILVAIPATNLIAKNLNAQSLIDRPFLSIFLFLPLSLVIGLGIAGLDRFIKQRSKLHISAQLITVLTIYLLLFPNPKVLSPLPNANLVSKNDIMIYQQIEKTIPEQSLILIPNFPPSYFFGIDGGVWLGYVTGLHIVRMAYNTDFASEIAFSEVCASSADYIYAGNKPYSFSSAEFERQRDRYELFLFYDDVKLYKVVGCP